MNKHDREKRKNKNKTSGSESGLKDLLFCTFCKKNQRQVKWLIAGEGVFICEECVKVCDNLIDQEECKLQIKTLEEKLKEQADEFKEMLKVIDGDEA